MSQNPPNEPSEEAIKFTAEILRGMLSPANGEQIKPVPSIRPAQPLAAVKAAVVESSEVPDPVQPKEEPLSPTDQRVIALIQKVEGLQRTIHTELNSPNFVNAVVLRLLSSDALLPMVQQTVTAALRELQNAVKTVGTAAAEAPEQPPIDTEPKLVAFRATLHNEGPEPGTWTPVRVAKLATNHPTNPDGFECFIDEGNDGHFVPCSMGPMAVTAVREAFAKHGIEDTGVFYWCELNQIWDKPPVGEDYVVISSGEKTITTVQTPDQIQTNL